jgi:acyl-CoA thioesterase FadM
VEAVDYIMAEITVRYRARILYPGTVRVGIRTASVGRTHFEMEYEIVDPDGRKLVTATSVQVMYDYAGGGSMGVPGELRETLETFEGRALPRRTVGK